MEIKENVVVLGARAVDFKDDEGKVIKGTSVFFYYDKKENKQGLCGHIPNKAFLDSDTFDALKGKEFPFQGIVNLELDLTAKTPKAKPVSFGLRK